MRVNAAARQPISDDLDSLYEVTIRIAGQGPPDIMLRYRPKGSDRLEIARTSLVYTQTSLQGVLEAMASGGGSIPIGAVSQEHVERLLAKVRAKLCPLERRDEAGRDRVRSAGATQARFCSPFTKPSDERTLVTMLSGVDPSIVARRLAPGDQTVARETFAVMAKVFEADASLLSDKYIGGLLARPDFWVFTAFHGDAVAGGLTAHTLPMTNFQGSDVFLYDIAVRADLQRRGIGRFLLQELRKECSEAGIRTIFVLADNEDTHALDFYRALTGSPSPVTMFEFGSARH